ncbi:MAG: hypothetical protein AAF587_25370 [Bacteroidota bacterium]
MNNFQHHFSLLFFLVLALLGMVQAQVSINETNTDPDPSAMLDVRSIDKGMLLPRMTSTERDAIANPADGLMIYNLDDSCFNYFSGAEWIKDCGRESQASVDKIWKGNAFDLAKDVATDQAGNIYVIGQFHDTIRAGDVELVSTGQADLYVAKFNSAGKILWANSLSGTGSKNPGGISVDAYGNSYVTGNFRIRMILENDTLLSESFSSDVFLAKYDPFGKLVWAKRGGGNSPDAATDIDVDPAGNSYVTGYFRNTFTIESLSLINPVSTSYEVLLMKVDPDGNPIWLERLGGTGDDIGYGIAVDSDGIVYATGSFINSATVGSTTLTSNGNQDVFITSFDAAGGFRWAASSGGPASDRGSTIALDVGGNPYIGGNFEGSVTFGNTSLTSNGLSDFFIHNYDALGVSQWAVGGGSVQADVITSLSLDHADNIYMAGILIDSIFLGNDTLSSTGEIKGFAAKYNPATQVQWAVQDVGPLSSQANGISWNVNGKVVMVGEFRGTSDFGNSTLSVDGTKSSYLWQINEQDGMNANSSISDIQDGDTDPSNELQSLFLSGGELTISGGNSQDLSGLDTDNQTIDNFNLNGTTLSLSLEDDAQADQTVDLSGLDTDNQTIDNFTLSGTTLSLSLEDDAQADQTVDLSGIDTDNQTIDKFNLNGTTLEISLKDDAQADQTVDLSSLGSDDLGNHIANQNLQLNSHYLSGDGDNEGIVIDHAGKVGIGNPTPETILHIGNGGNPILKIDGASNTAGSGPRLRWTEEYSSDFGIEAMFEGVQDVLKFRGLQNGLVSVDNILTIMRNTGNIGIGTDQPQHLMDFGNTLGRKLALYQNTGGTSLYGFGISNNAIEVYAAAGAGDNPDMVIEGSDGNVGIATTDPQSKLHIVNGTDVSPTNHGYLLLGDVSSQNIAIDNNEIMGRNNGSPSILYIQGEGGSTILSGDGGNVGIGTNTPTKAKVEIAGSGSSYTVSGGSGEHNPIARDRTENVGKTLYNSSCCCYPELTNRSHSHHQKRCSSYLAG